jgi:transcriptional regulator with XRE-family HTH domain
MATTTISPATVESETLRARRLAVGLTQRQLAIAAGCSLTWVSNIEAGCIPHRSDALERIRAALDQAESPIDDFTPAANGREEKPGVGAPNGKV